MYKSEGDNKKRTYRLSIALSKEENAVLTRFCDEHGMSKSYFARRSIFLTMARYDNRVKKRRGKTVQEILIADL